MSAAPEVEAPPAARGAGSARSAAISFAGAISAAVLGFALTVVVGRGLGPSGAGQFYAVTGIFFVLCMGLKLGADTAMVWALPRLRAHQQQQDTRTTVWVGLRPVWVVSVVVAVLVCAAAPWISPIIFGAQHRDSGTTLLRIIAGLLVFAAPMLVALYVTRGLGSVVPFTLIYNVVLPLLRVLMILAVLVAGVGLGHRLEAVMLAWSLPLVLAAVASFVLMARALRAVEARHRSRAPADREPARPRQQISAQLWRYARPRAVSALLEIALVWADVLMVSALAGPREAGIYGAASRFVTTGTLAEAALRVALSPRLSELLAKNQLHEAGRLVGLASVWITAVSWPLYLVLATFGPFVLRLFGHEFAQGSTALAILAMAMALALTAGNVQTVLLMSGHSHWQLMNKAVALTVDVGLCALLIPALGMVGAAWAWAAAILIDAALAVWQVRYRVGVRADAQPAQPHPGRGVQAVVETLRRRGLGLVSVALSALVLYGGLGVLLRCLMGATIQGFVLYLCLASLAYAAVLWLLRPVLGAQTVLASLRRRG